MAFCLQSQTQTCQHSAIVTLSTGTHYLTGYNVSSTYRFQSKISLLWTAMVSSSCSILDMMVITRSRTSSVLHEPANNKHHQNEPTPPSPWATGKRTQDGRQIDGEPHDGALGESWCAGLQIRLEQDGVASIGDLLLSCLEVSACWRRSSPSSRWLSQPNHKIVMNMQNK